MECTHWPLGGEAIIVDFVARSWDMWLHSTIFCGMQLLIHAWDTCFWQQSPHFQKCMILMPVIGWIIGHFLWNCSQGHATKPHHREIKIGSGNDLVPSGTKPLPEPMLTKIYVVMWGHNKKKTLHCRSFSVQNLRLGMAHFNPLCAEIFRDKIIGHVTQQLLQGHIACIFCETVPVITRPHPCLSG